LVRLSVSLLSSSEQHKSIISVFVVVVVIGSKSLRFELESPITSGCIYDFEFETNDLRGPGLAEASKSNYKSERVVMSSKDGTKVPFLSLIYSEDERFWSSFSTQNRIWTS
jgi:protease II